MVTIDLALKSWLSVLFVQSLPVEQPERMVPVPVCTNAMNDPSGGASEPKDEITPPAPLSVQPLKLPVSKLGFVSCVLRLLLLLELVLDVLTPGTWPLASAESVSGDVTDTIGATAFVGPAVVGRAGVTTGVMIADVPPGPLSVDA